jgi:hypothetical protein
MGLLVVPVSVGGQGATAGQAPPGGRGAAQDSGGTGQFGGRGRAMTPSALRAIPAETTAAKATNPNWKVPRTSWGHPDLQGIWTSDDMRGVPMVRPAGQATRESLTPEEFAQRAGRDEASRDAAVNQETFLRNEFGVRTFGYTSFIVDPPDGRLPQLTPDGIARRNAVAGVGTFGTGPFNTFEDFTLYDRCITRGVGGIFPVLYGNGLRIVQSPTDVVLSYEMVHDTRVIPLDGRPHVGSGIRQYMGDSRGRWEGDTLVIETTNFTDKTSIGGPPHSHGLRLTEWLTRIDPQMIDYRMRVDDPATYTAPFTVRLTITQQPGYELYEYSCHEGNGAVKYALSADREWDRRVEEAKAKGLPIPPRNMGMEVYTGAPVEGRQPVREFGGK